MGLEDYSTQELRAEIARRSPVKYKYAQGVVTEILNSDSAFLLLEMENTFDL